MTNREMMIKALTDDFDDWAETESDIAYHIACPYTDGDHPCKGLDYPWNTLDVCGPCKAGWLDEEAVY